MQVWGVLHSDQRCDELPFFLYPVYLIQPGETTLISYNCRGLCCRHSGAVFPHSKSKKQDLRPAFFKIISSM